MKIKGTTDGSKMFWCPGCDEPHCVDPKRWIFNSDNEKPTFMPSILVTGFEAPTDEEHEMIMSGQEVARREMRCHSYVTNGMIQFLGDCTHDKKNTTVDLPEWDS